MRCLALLMLGVLLAATPLRAEEPADSIQAVITSQLMAFQADDLDAAFAHASPTIQTKFRNPEMFGQMVATGYPVIWRPSGYEMLDLRQTAMGPVQMVLFQDAQGRFYEAAYEMRPVDGVWRINGVYLRKSPGFGS